MTDFQPIALNGIWKQTKESIKDVLLTERGKQSEILSKDESFMMICVLKHCNKWKLKSCVFNQNVRCLGECSFAPSNCRSILYKEFVTKALH